jgi:dTDP-4-amino-4,6-dideoxygalactose transaminase
MKYPYSSPNFRIIDLLKSLLLSEEAAKDRIKQYFSEITGKRYILIMNSCRTALYLAYRAIETTGEVITSPLTCKVAIDPIIESGNIPVYADINKGDLNINQVDIEHRITDATIAIQAIHFGGVSCDMNRIMDIANKYKITVIEDCAQSLGANFEQKKTGSFGSVSCLSLIKNAYGIGGGIFATNSEKFYEIASNIQKGFKKTENKIIGYRILRSIVDSNRNLLLGRLLYNIITLFKGSYKNYYFLYTKTGFSNDLLN